MPNDWMARRKPERSSSKNRRHGELTDQFGHSSHPDWLQIADCTKGTCEKALNLVCASNWPFGWSNPLFYCYNSLLCGFSIRSPLLFYNIFASFSILFLDFLILTKTVKAFTDAIALPGLASLNYVRSITQKIMSIYRPKTAYPHIFPPL